MNTFIAAGNVTFGGHSYLSAPPVDQGAKTSWAVISYLVDPLAEICKAFAKCWDFARKQPLVATPKFDTGAMADATSHLMVPGYIAPIRQIAAYRTARLVDPIDGAAPNEEHIAAAARGLSMLMIKGMPAPSALLQPDGTICVYWRSGSKYSSIDFETDGAFTWASTDGSQFWSGTWSLDQELPEQVKVALEKH